MRFLNQPHENYSPAQSLHLCAMCSVSCDPAPDRAGPMRNVQVTSVCTVIPSSPSSPVSAPVPPESSLEHGELLGCEKRSGRRCQAEAARAEG